MRWCFWLPLSVKDGWGFQGARALGKEWFLMKFPHLFPWFGRALSQAGVMIYLLGYKGCTLCTPISRAPHVRLGQRPRRPFEAACLWRPGSEPRLWCVVDRILYHTYSFSIAFIVHGMLATWKLSSRIYVRYITQWYENCKSLFFLNC